MVAPAGAERARLDLRHSRWAAARPWRDARRRPLTSANGYSQSPNSLQPRVGFAWTTPANAYMSLVRSLGVAATCQREIARRKKTALGQARSHRRRPSRQRPKPFLPLARHAPRRRLRHERAEGAGEGARAATRVRVPRHRTA